MAKKQHHEHKEQVALFEWAAYFPKLRWMHTIPNGAHLAGNKIQRAKQMARLKAEGLTPGVLDVFLPLPMPPYHGLYIEMKRADGEGRLSQDQKDFRAYAELQGYKVAVCNGFREAVEVITKYAKI